MSRQSLKRMKPTDIILPITPMLDMSFQLLFFFICIYHPPMSQEGQFLLDLTPRKVKTPVEKGNEGPNQPPVPEKPDDNPFDKEKIQWGYDPEIIVSTHIGAGAKEGEADYMITQIAIRHILPEAKKVLFPGNSEKDSILVPEAPPEQGKEASLEREEEIFKRLPDILREARDKIPPDAATPRVLIRAPRDIRMYKIVRLMDECTRAGFGVSLKVLNQ